MIVREYAVAFHAPDGYIDNGLVRFWATVEAARTYAEGVVAKNQYFTAYTIYKRLETNEVQ